MSTHVVGVDHNGVSAFNDRLIFVWPIRAKHSCLHVKAALLVESFCEESAAGIKFVFTWAMTSIACNEDNMFDVLSLLVRHEKGAKKSQEKGNKESKTFHK